MDHADQKGLGLAVVGHLLLFAALTISIAKRVPPVQPKVEAMDVQLVDAVGLRSAAPQPATEAPQEMQAPDQAAPQEAPPPVPSAATPTPTQAKPTPVTSSPTPAIKPKSQPPAKALSDILKDVQSRARNEQAGSDAQAKADRAAAAKVGSLLKGVLGASAGKGETARAAMTGAAANDIGGKILKAVMPCAERQVTPGPGAERIRVAIKLQLNRDGSLAARPIVVGHDGVDDENRRYQSRVDDLAIATFMGCSPISGLPADLYDVPRGWANFTMRYKLPG